MHLPCGSWNVRLVLAMFESLPSLWNFPQYWNHVGFWESRVRFAYKLQNYFCFFSAVSLLVSTSLHLSGGTREPLCVSSGWTIRYCPWSVGIMGKNSKESSVFWKISILMRGFSYLYYLLYGYQVMIGFLCSIFWSIELVLKYTIENEFWILNIKGIVLSALSHG